MVPVMTATDCHHKDRPHATNSDGVSRCYACAKIVAGWPRGDEVVIAEVRADDVDAARALAGRLRRG